MYSHIIYNLSVIAAALSNILNWNGIEKFNVNGRGGYRRGTKRETGNTSGPVNVLKKQQHRNKVVDHNVTVTVKAHNPQMLDLLLLLILTGDY